MNSAQAGLDDAPRLSRLSGFSILLAAGCWLIAGAGCHQAEYVAPSNPGCSVYTPTRWHCWEDGPLAYRDCGAPFCCPPADAPGPRAPESQPLPNGSVPETIPPEPPQLKVLPPEQPESGGQPAEFYTHFADNDPRMNAAIKQARSTVGLFIAALKSPHDDQARFAVWMAFTDGKKTEHMRLTNVTFDGNVLEGKVDDEPREVKNVRVGQAVQVEPAKISDWMYVENHKLVGGYTLRALRQAMPPPERTAFDSSLPFAIY